MSVLSCVVCSVGDRLKCEQSLFERLKNEFMLQQLVNIVSSLDLSDEMARSAVSPLPYLLYIFYSLPVNRVSLQCFDTAG